MASHLVGQNAISTFTTPVNGTSPIDANQVRGNDNTIKTTYNTHDADATIHFQDSALADRAAFGTAGRKWLTTDSGALYLFYDTGSAWSEVSYLRSTGGTMTGALTITTTSAPQLQVQYDSSNELEVSVASNGAVTFDAKGAGAAFTFSDAATFSSTLTVSGTATIGAATNPILINRLTDLTAYGAISFNGVLTETGMVGIFARAAADDVNYRAQSGGHAFFNGSTRLGGFVSSGLFALAGTSSSFPALKRNGADIELRLADDSGRTNLILHGLTAHNGITVTAGTTAVQALTATTGAFSSGASANGITLTSTATATGVSLDNAHASSRGSYVEFKQGGTIRGYTIVSGAWLGTTASNFAVVANTGSQLEFYTNASTTVGMTLSTGNVLTVASGLTVSAGTTAVQAFTAATTAVMSGTATFGTSYALDTGGYVTTASQDGTGFKLRHNSGLRNMILGCDSGTGITINADNSVAVGTFTASGAITTTDHVNTGAGASFCFTGRSRLRSSADGVVTLFNNADSDFGRLNFGGTSSSFPALARSGTELRVRLADNSGYADIRASNVTAEGGVIQTTSTGQLALSGRGSLRASADGVFNLRNDANSNYGSLQVTTAFLTNAAEAAAVGNINLGGSTQTTVGAAGGASALPATPTGYWIINVAGTNRVVPFYAAS